MYTKGDMMWTVIMPNRACVTCGCAVEECECECEEREKDEIDYTELPEFSTSEV
jgi:predicted nucleic acid-binding Zn ribbon protein